jgi:hypothetical protein
MRTLAITCAAALVCLPLSTYGQTTSPPVPKQEEQTKPTPVEQQVTVYATRTDGRLEDQPTRVELVDQEEVDEKTMMTPGNIVIMLNETSGIRVQNTSPSLGSSTVRIQGMKVGTHGFWRMDFHSSVSKAQGSACCRYLLSISAGSKLSREWSQPCTEQARWEAW